MFSGLYHDFVPSSGKVVIGNNVVFGINVTILKGVTIGDNCIIGLGSIITKDIPSNSVASGAPAKVVCSIHDYYLRRKQRSVIESFDYVSSIIESKKRKPIITDFEEEWALFFRQSDFEIYPEMHSIIDWRLKDSAKEYWETHRPLFDGFDDFMNEYKKYNNKTSI